MGDYTANEFADHLEFSFGMDSGIRAANLPNSGSTNMYNKWLNAAYHDITERGKFWNLNKRFYFPELEDDTTRLTTDGTAYIEYPSTCYYPQELYDETNNRYLTWKPWSWYVKKTDRSDTSKEGEPSHWTRRAASGSQYIYLHPTPDTDDETIRVYFRRRVVDISDTDTTLIGAEWDEPILMLAMFKGKIRMNDWEAAERLKDEWIDMVKDRRDTYTPEEMSRKEYFRLHPGYTKK